MTVTDYQPEPDTTIFEPSIPWKHCRLYIWNIRIHVYDSDTSQQVFQTIQMSCYSDVIFLYQRQPYYIVTTFVPRQEIRTCSLLYNISTGRSNKKYTSDEDFRAKLSTKNEIARLKLQLQLQLSWKLKLALFLFLTPTQPPLHEKSKSKLKINSNLTSTSTIN